MNKKFRESYKLLLKEVETPTNSIMWTAGEMDTMSYIECWLVQSKGTVIYQVFPDGKGFNEYIVLTTTEKNASSLLIMLKSLMMSMKAHPDCTDGSEFDDMVSLAEELIQETTGVKLKSV